MMDLGDDDGFELGFELPDPDALAAALAEEARRTQELFDRIQGTAAQSIGSLRSRLSPIADRIGSATAGDLRAAAAEIGPTLAAVPLVAVAPPRSVPPLVPQVGVPVPPGVPIPEPPVGERRDWSVWAWSRCIGFRRARIDNYVVGPGYPPPPADAVLCRGGLTEQEAISGRESYCPSGEFEAPECVGDPVPPVEPPAEPPTTPEPPSEPPSCPKCQCCACSCEPEPPSEPKPRYCLWNKAESGECVILAEEQAEPPAPGFVKVTCSEEIDALESLKRLLCGKPDQPTDKGWPTVGASDSPVCDPRLIFSPEFAAAWSSILSRVSYDAVALPQARDEIKAQARRILSLIMPPGTGVFWSVIVDKVVDWFGGFYVTEQGRLSVATGCSQESTGLLGISLAFLSLVEKYFVRIPPRISAPLQYAEAYQCPWLLPTPAEARALYLSGVIDSDAAISLGRFGGVCPDTQFLLSLAGQSRLTPGEIVAAVWRDLLPRDRAAQELRARGFLAEDALDLQESLAKFVPGPSDIVRFLVRDVADDAIVARFRLDDEFSAKLGGTGSELLRYARAQGVDESALRYYWRAHWAIPSPTQLGEFWRRLRPPESVDPARAARIGLSGRVPAWSPRSDARLIVNEPDIDAALGQQDILPFWRDKFRAVQFLPLTRVDARRAYDIGVLDIDDVFESLVQDGYSTENAGILAEFAKKEKQLGVSNSEPAKLYRDGLIDESDARFDLRDLGFDAPVIDRYIERVDRQRLRTAYGLPEFADYVAGIIDETELRLELMDRHYSPTMIDRVIERANLRLRARFRQDCTSSIETRYMLGEFDDDRARRQLVGQGWSEPAAEAIVAGWNCRRSTNDKLPTVRQLLSFLQEGVITDRQFRDRMQTLRYSDADIDAFIAQAVVRGLIAESKQAEKEAAKQAREIEKQRRAEERAARERERKAANLSRAVQAAKDETEKVGLLIASAVKKYSTVNGLDPAPVSDRLTDALDSGQELWGLSAVASARAIVQAIDYLVAAKSTDIDAALDLFFEAVREAADAAAE